MPRLAASFAPCSTNALHSMSPADCLPHCVARSSNNRPTRPLRLRFTPCTSTNVAVPSALPHKSRAAAARPTKTVHQAEFQRLAFAVATRAANQTQRNRAIHTFNSAGQTQHCCQRSRTPPPTAPAPTPRRQREPRNKESNAHCCVGSSELVSLHVHSPHNPRCSICAKQQIVLRARDARPSDQPRLRSYCSAAPTTQSSLPAPSAPQRDEQTARRHNQNTLGHRQRFKLTCCCCWRDVAHRARDCCVLVASRPNHAAHEWQASTPNSLWRHSSQQLATKCAHADRCAHSYRAPPPRSAPLISTSNANRFAQSAPTRNAITPQMSSAQNWV